MNDVGLYGLGVMGQSLSHNIASKGFKLAVYNIDYKVTEDFLPNTNIEGYKDIETFIKSLSIPRKIILMVTAGHIVDQVVDSLLPFLSSNDIIIDCGNSFYLDSEKRQRYCLEKEIHFIACGVSGGERGALLGPSIMPSGDEFAYEEIKPIFEKIAALNEDGTACCTYIGKGGAGHFVKMVHNGIEYADMQCIGETYGILKKLLHNNNEEIQKAFYYFQEGELKSYLIGITADIFNHFDEDGSYVLDHILDVAKQKGTGKWTSQTALDFGLCIPSINEAVNARFLSDLKEERMQCESIYGNSTCLESYLSLRQVEEAMLAVKISIYAQGFALIHTVSKQCDYGIDLANLARIWQNGCIIKSSFLKKIMKAFQDEPTLNNLIQSKIMVEELKANDKSWRECVKFTIDHCLYSPVFSSSLHYVDGYKSGKMDMNMIQAQRDYFGAHTYQKINQEGSFHTIWE